MPARLSYTGPADRSETYTLLNGEVIIVDQGMQGAIDDLKSLDPMDRIEVLGITDRTIEEYKQKRIQMLSDKALKYIRKYDWEWSVTGEKADIDQEFLEDHMGIDVKKPSLVRKLREYRSSVSELKEITRVFETGDLRKMEK